MYWSNLRVQSQLDALAALLVSAHTPVPLLFNGTSWHYQRLGSLVLYNPVKVKSCCCLSSAKRKQTTALKCECAVNLYPCLLYRALHSESVFLQNYLAVYVSPEEVTIPSSVQQQPWWELLLQTPLHAPRPHPVSYHGTTHPVFLFFQWPPRGKKYIYIFIWAFNSSPISSLML